MTRSIAVFKLASNFQESNGVTAYFFEVICTRLRCMLDHFRLKAGREFRPALIHIVVREVIVEQRVASTLLYWRAAMNGTGVNQHSSTCRRSQGDQSFWLLRQQATHLLITKPRTQRILRLHAVVVTDHLRISVRAGNKLERAILRLGIT